MDGWQQVRETNGRRNGTESEVDLGRKDGVDSRVGWPEGVHTNYSLGVRHRGRGGGGGGAQVHPHDGARTVW